jgi:hypothetical protein
MEVLFGAFKWMVETGHEYDGMISALCGNPTCTGYGCSTNGFSEDYIKDLKKRFEFILNSCFIKKGVVHWKRKYNVDLMTERVIPLKYHKHGSYGWMSNVELEKGYKKLFTYKGRELKESLNDCHPKAKTIKGTCFRLIPDYIGVNIVFRFVFEFSYGYSISDGSSWNFKIKQNDNELLPEFFKRAVVEIESKLN